MSKTLKSNWLNLLTIFLFVLAVAGFALYFTKPTFQAERVPGFNLNKFDGSLERLENLRGKPIVLNFWAEWCIFCRDEMPIMQKIYEKNKDTDLVFLGVHRSETEKKEVGEAFAKSVGVTYELVSDPKDRLFNYFGGGAQTVPITIFINRDGFVETKVVGPRSEEEFQILVEKILN